MFITLDNIENVTKLYEKARHSKRNLFVSLADRERDVNTFLNAYVQTICLQKGPLSKLETQSHREFAVDLLRGEESVEECKAIIANSFHRGNVLFRSEHPSLESEVKFAGDHVSSRTSTIPHDKKNEAGDLQTSIDFTDKQRPAGRSAEEKSVSTTMKQSDFFKQTETRTSTQTVSNSQKAHIIKLAEKAYNSYHAIFIRPSVREHDVNAFLKAYAEHTRTESPLNPSAKLRINDEINQMLTIELLDRYKTVDAFKEYINNQLSDTPFVPTAIMKPK